MYIPRMLTFIHPLGFKHVNLLGRYAFTLADIVARRTQTATRSQRNRH